MRFEMKGHMLLNLLSLAAKHGEMEITSTSVGVRMMNGKSEPFVEMYCGNKIIGHFYPKKSDYRLGHAVIDLSFTYKIVPLNSYEVFDDRGAMSILPLSG